MATVVPVRRKRRGPRKVNQMTLYMRERGWKWSTELGLWVPIRDWRQDA